MQATTPELKAITEAIEGQHWLLCQDCLEQLLEKVSAADSVKFAVAQLKMSLRSFEELRPKIRWAREALNLMTNAEPLPDTFEFEPPVEGANPIVTNFIDGLERIDQAVQAQDRPHYVTTQTARAVACAVNARRFHYFSRHFPQDWRLVVKREAGADDLPPLRSKFMDEPKVQDFTMIQWLQVVETLGPLLPDREP